MTDQFPPIPPGGAVPPPPPGPSSVPPPPPYQQPRQPVYQQPPYGGTPGYPPAAAPAGYQAYGGAYGSGAPLKAVSGVRTATVALFAVASVSAVLLGLVAYQRGGVVDDFFNADGSLSDVDDADGRVAAVFLLLLAAQIAAAVLVAVWSNRTTSNAKARGATDVSPGLAAGGWFIPIGNYFVPWGQLAKAAGRFGSVPSMLRIWQAMFIGQAVLTVVARIVVSDGQLDSLDDGGGAFRNQGILYIVAGLALGVATFAASRAMKEVDALTTPS